jgi:hypothetical protein
MVGTVSLRAVRNIAFLQQLAQKQGARREEFVEVNQEGDILAGESLQADKTNLADDNACAWINIIFTPTGFIQTGNATGMGLTQPLMTEFEQGTVNGFNQLIQSAAA